MKKNRIFILGIVTMFVAILSLTLVSGTLARYTSSGKGYDEIQVAKWDVKIQGTKITSVDPQAQEFDLFDTVNYDEGGDDVVNGKIAPGTDGMFSFTVNNSSEVNAKYNVVFDANTYGVPLEWSTSGEDDTWKTDLSQLNISDKELDMNATDNVVIYWRWVFEVDAAGNVTDTGLGSVDTPVKPRVTITVTFNQVD